MADDITKAIHGARQAQIDRIRKGMSNAAEVLAPEGEIKKSQEVDEQEKDIQLFLKACGDSDIEKEKGDDDDDDKGGEDGEKKVEKSDIAEALSRGNLNIKKSGKEIKDQIANVILPDLTAKLAAKEADATKYLEECGKAPTRDVPAWWSNDIRCDCGYKYYDWDETYYREDEQRMMPTFTAEDEAAKKGNRPENRAQAEARQHYNDAVRAICNLKVDIKTCEVMTTNLNDKTDYELTARQAIVLRF